MSRPGPFKLMYKNWKQSTLYVTVGGGSLGFYYDYTLTNDIMKTSCRRAANYGDEHLKNPNSPVRHITVILNPVANKRKSKKLYTKWVEPLFHLAGIKVSLLETDSPNQAYSLMKIMSNCDGVAIVGGDGTVHEAINGLLSRPDSTKATRDFPIGIIPAGQYNSIARYVHQHYVQYRNQKEFLIQATMRIVDSCMKKHDVLKVEPLDEELKKQKADDLPIYALRDIRYGIYQDNFYKLSGYKLYQNYIKPIWFRLQRTFSPSSNYPPPRIDSVSYTEPCEGCQTCYEKHRLKNSQQLYNQQAPEQQSANKRWWSIVVPVSKSQPSEEERRELELSKRVNPNCQRWINVDQLEDLTDFRACMMGDKKVRLSLGRGREYNPSDISETQDVRLKVATELDDEMKLDHAIRDSETTTADQEVNDKKDEKKKRTQFLIDGQPTQAHSIEITALDRAVTIFTGPNKIFIPKAPSTDEKRKKRL